MAANRRQSIRWRDLLAVQARSSLKVRGELLDAIVTDVSPGGFGVCLEREPKANVGDVVELRTIAGSFPVRVAFRRRHESERFHLGLELVSEIAFQNGHEGATVSMISSSGNDASSHRSAKEIPIIANQTADRSDGRGAPKQLPAIGIVGIAVLVAVAPTIWNGMGRDPRELSGSRPDQRIASRVPPAQPEPTSQPPVRPTQIGGDALPSGGTERRWEEGHPASLSKELAAPAPHEVSNQNDGESANGALKPQTSNEAKEADGTIELTLSLPSERPHGDDTPLEDTAQPSPEALAEKPAASAQVPVRAASENNSPTVEQSKAIIELQKSASTWFSIGLLHYWRREFDRAIPAFEAAAAYRPNDPTYGYFLALSLFVGGRRPEAERVLQAAVQLESRHVAPDLGRVMERVQGPHRLWMENARRAAKVGPYHPRD